MPNLHTLKNSFAGGEIAPSLYNRIDLSLYSKAAKFLKNWIVHPWGGASNRPGTIYQGVGKFENKEIRLIPFKFSTLQNYILELGEYYIRFFTNLSGVASQIMTNVYSPDTYTKLLMHFDGSNGGVVLTEETGKTVINTPLTMFDAMEYSTDGLAQAAYASDDASHLQCYSEATIKTEGDYSLKVVADTSSLGKTLTKSF